MRVNWVQQGLLLSFNQCVQILTSLFPHNANKRADGLMFRQRVRPVFKVHLAIFGLYLVNNMQHRLLSQVIVDILSSQTSC